MFSTAPLSSHAFSTVALPRATVVASVALPVAWAAQGVTRAIVKPQRKPRYVVPSTVRPAATSSTVAIYATLRQAMIDYVTPQKERLKDFVGEPPRVFVRAQPEPVVYPYVTLLLSSTSLAAFNGYRQTMLLEVQAIGRPDAQLPTVESAMDVIDQCMTAYTFAGDGLIVGRSRTRATIPQFTTPAEQLTVGVIATYELYVWPQVLSSRAML